MVASEVKLIFERERTTEDSNGRLTTQQTYNIKGVSSTVEARRYGPAIGTPFGDGTDMVVMSKTSERVGAEVCTLVVKYESADGSSGSQSQQLDYVYWDTDIGLQSQHITAVEKSSDRSTQPASVVDPENLAIGKNGDQVEGVDVLVPYMELSARVLRKRSYWTNNYERIVAELASKVNLATFRGWNAGEVMFVGAQKSDTGDKYLNLSYKFRVEANRIMSSADINSITVSLAASGSLTKYGHDYLWFEHGSHFDTGTNVQKNGIIAVHVDKVYKRADFSVLGIT